MVHFQKNLNNGFGQHQFRVHWRPWVHQTQLPTVQKMLCTIVIEGNWIGMVTNLSAGLQWFSVCVSDVSVSVWDECGCRCDTVCAPLKYYIRSSHWKWSQILIMRLWQKDYSICIWKAILVMCIHFLCGSILLPAVWFVFEVGAITIDSPLNSSTEESANENRDRGTAAQFIWDVCVFSFCMFKYLKSGVGRVWKHCQIVKTSNYTQEPGLQIGKVLELHFYRIINMLKSFGLIIS